MPLMEPHVKFARAVRRVRDLAPAVVEALECAETGVPGPVFVECPVDLLYDEDIIRGWYADSKPKGDGLADKAVRAYLDWHANRLFAGGDQMPKPAAEASAVLPRPDAIRDIARRLATAKRPVMVVGSQALARAGAVIMPANPGFYHRPAGVSDLGDFIVARVLDHLGIRQALVPPWGGDAEQAGEQDE
jgi:acetolactate synthase-1/2/3 large subunit